MIPVYFKDRKDAGIRLGEALVQYKGQDVIVYALPRGGVVRILAKLKHPELTLRVCRADLPEFTV